MTTAAEQGRLWSAHAGDWAAQEEMEPERFEPAADAGAARRRAAGGRLRLRRPPAPWRRSAARACTGSTPRPRCVELARRRVPGADVRVGDAEALPYPDASFDLVAGFNVFFFASDLVAALREAGRVARPGAPVIAGVWGRPEACDMLRVVAAVRALGGPPGGAGPSLAEPGVLEGLAARAGLEPDLAFDRTLALHYPDLETFVRRVRSAGPMAAAAEAHGADAVAGAVRAGAAPFRRPDGSVRLENEWRYLVSRASSRSAFTTAPESTMIASA